MNARSLAITRAVAVIGGTGALIAAATFAAATSNPVTISGINLAATDVNVLQIFDFGGAGFTGDTSNPGNTGPIDLTLAPGTESNKIPFYLKNLDGTDALAISASASNPGTGGLDPTQIQVKFYDDNSTLLATTTLSALESGSVPFTSPAGDLQAGAQGNSGAPGTNGNYNVTFELLNPVSSFVNLNGVQLEFTGTQITP